METFGNTRRFKDEFVDDVEEIKQKTSRSKKTLHGMLNFMNERVRVRGWGWSDRI